MSSLRSRLQSLLPGSSKEQKSDEPTDVVLLGVQESGKTTLWRQFIHLYADVKETPSDYVGPIWISSALAINRLTVDTIRFLTDSSAFPKFTNASLFLPAQVETSEFWKDLVDFFNILPVDLLRLVISYYWESMEPLKKTYGFATPTIPYRITTQLPRTPENATGIRALWSDPLIRHVYRHRNRASAGVIYDSSAHFLNEIERIAKKDYEPTDADIIAAKNLEAIGTMDAIAAIEGQRFRLWKVNGSRYSRLKWLHLPKQELIYVVSLPAYDQAAPEEGATTTQMKVSLDTYSWVLEREWFRPRVIFLIFTKSDVWAERLSLASFLKCFPDYKGKKESGQMMDYIISQFVARSGKQRVQAFIVNSLQTDECKRVYDQIFHLLTEQEGKKKT